MTSKKIIVALALLLSATSITLAAGRYQADGSFAGAGYDAGIESQR